MTLKTKRPPMPPTAVVAIGDMLVLLRRLHRRDLPEASLQTLRLVRAQIDRIDGEADV
jgi:hypothetical protein